MQRAFIPLQKSLTVALSLLFVSWSTYPSLVYAQVTAPVLLAQRFNPPSGTGGGRPTQMGTLGTHGPCDVADANQKSITPLLPKYQDWITTTAAHPTFWFDLPFSASEFASIDFVLQNQAREPVYEATLAPPASTAAGIISITLPDTAPALEPNQTYRWLLILTCPVGTEITLRNDVTRVSVGPELETALNAATTPEAQAAAYAEHGIWLDALTVLGDRRRADPSNTTIQNAWTELLSDEDINLANLASEPIGDCCSFAGD